MIDHDRQLAPERSDHDPDALLDHEVYPSLGEACWAMVDAMGGPEPHPGEPGYRPSADYRVTR